MVDQASLIQKRVVGSEGGVPGMLVFVNKLSEIGVETVPFGAWRVNVYLEIVSLGNPKVKVGISPRVIKWHCLGVNASGFLWLSTYLS